MSANVFESGNKLLLNEFPALDDKSALKLCKLLDKGGTRLADAQRALTKRPGRR